MTKICSFVLLYEPLFVYHFHVGEMIFQEFQIGEKGNTN